MAHVRVEKRDGFAHVVMCKEPVNSMDGVFWGTLGDTLTALEADASVHGIIFSSGLKRDVFTAGNDLTELYMPATTRAKFTRFWTAQTRFLARLYRSPLVTLAAIRGACPAGGCILALCCDERIMTSDAASCIGLNEVALGIAVPRYWAQVMAAQIGHGTAHKLLTTAAMPKAHEALKLGLVDALVPQAELLAAAEKRLKKLMQFPPQGIAMTKYALRGKLAEEWEAWIPEEIDMSLKLLNEPSTVSALAGVLKRLSGGKAKL